MSILKKVFNLSEPIGRWEYFLTTFWVGLISAMFFYPATTFLFKLQRIPKTDISDTMAILGLLALLLLIIIILVGIYLTFVLMLKRIWDVSANKIKALFITIFITFFSFFTSGVLQIIAFILLCFIPGKLSGQNQIRHEDLKP